MARWSGENLYDSIIHHHATRFGVPVWVIKATIAKESSFNPRAYREEPAIRDASRGLMQLLERTARGLGYKGIAGDPSQGSLEGLFDPQVNIHLGVKLLSQLRRRYPGEEWDAIYAAYNSGAVRRNNAGEFVNSRGSTNVEQHVAGWRRAAQYFAELEGLQLPFGGCPACEAGEE